MAYARMFGMMNATKHKGFGVENRIHKREQTPKNFMHHYSDAVPNLSCRCGSSSCELTQKGLHSWEANWKNFGQFDSPDMC